MTKPCRLVKAWIVRPRSRYCKPCLPPDLRVSLSGGQAILIHRWPLASLALRDLSFCSRKCRTIIIVDNERICVFLQNLLRNAAKSGCQTNYTYIPDIDMVPFPGMDVQLEEFLATPEVTCFFAQWPNCVHQQQVVWVIYPCLKAKECGMCAYVVPTYEIAQDSVRLDIFAIMENDIFNLNIAWQTDARWWKGCLTEKYKYNCQSNCKYK